MSRRQKTLPLPSRCGHCRLAVKAVLHTVNHTATIVWVHDASIGSALRKAGAHEPTPDFAYQPQRARLIEPPVGDFIVPMPYRRHVVTSAVA